MLIYEVNPEVDEADALKNQATEKFGQTLSESVRVLQLQSVAGFPEGSEEA